MRMRKRKNLEPRMEACAAFLESVPARHKGRWKALSGGRPIYLEVGCGKGRFICETAAANPDSFFVAAERVPSVLLLALEKAKAMALSNVLFIQTDAALLGEVFDSGEIAGMYLNFSDPWPQKRHWKRRLTHKSFLRVYGSFLASEAEIAMKTDNPRLFEFSLCQFSQCGYTLYDITFDLHSTDTPNILTEYEANFAGQGMNIFRCVAKKNSASAVMPNIFVDNSQILL